MGKKRTEKSKFESKYGGGWISAAQWLAELMCERQAAKKKMALSIKFWKNELWEKEFAYQLMLANRLMKLYSIQAVGKALRRKEARSIFSLNAPWFIDLVKEEHAKILQERALFDDAPKVENTNDTTSLPNSRPSIPKQSVRNKLKDL